MIDVRFDLQKFAAGSPSCVRCQIGDEVNSRATKLLAVFAIGLAKTFFDSGLDFGEQILAVQIGAGQVVGKPAALVWPRLMDGAAFGHPVRSLKDAGAILLDLEGIFVFQVPVANFAVTDPQMPGHPADIRGREQQRRAFQAVTAVAGAVITVDHRFLKSKIG